MKNYVAFESAKPKKGRYSFKIYRIKYNKPIYIGYGEFTYASTRGVYSEVMNKLIEFKEIPKKHHGYYEAVQNKNFNIEYIVPENQ